MDSKARSVRDALRWKRRYTEYQEINRLLRLHGKEILESQKFRSTREHIQHGEVTVHQHCLNVTMASIHLAKVLPFRVKEKDLVRGALLHDFFLYDWHIPDPVNPHKWHGFHHAARALKNAMNDYELSEIEKEIIRKHMWPLNIKPPMCREAWIVTIADKYISTKETLHMIKGHGKAIDFSKRKAASGE